MKKIVAVFGVVCTAIGLVHGQGTVPVISSFSPQSGAVGTVVNITGTNFDPTPGNNRVYFGAVQAVVGLASATNLVASVPAGATYAPITETVNGLTAYANAPFVPTFSSGGVFANSSLGTRLDLTGDTSPDVVVIGDLDGDGKPDLVVHNGHNTISIFRNISTNGSLTAGSFGPRIDLPIGGSQSTAGGVALADLNGDGRLDIITSSYVDGKVSVFQNFCSLGTITANSFGPRVDIPVNGGPVTLAVQDLDGDGWPDIVTGSFYSSTVSVLRNLGDAGIITSNSFASQVDYPVGTNARWVAIADLDGDGKPDVVSVNYNDGSGMMSVLRNTSTPGSITINSFAPQVEFATLPDDGAVAIGDLDGNGKPDVVIASGASGQVISVFRNTSTQGSITTNSFAPRADFAAGGWANGVALGDLDGDGKPDVAAVMQLPSHLSVFRNTSTPGSFTTSSLAARLDLTSGTNPYGVAIGDLDGDGRPEIIFANNNGATISIYQNVIPFSGPPIITSQPASSTNIVGTTATFTVAAAGSISFDYQWSENGTNIDGATTSTLTLTSVQLSQNGNCYSVRVTNLDGATNSLAAVLTVNPPPPSVPAPSGLVAWWPAEGNANDIIGGNNGTMINGATFVTGEAGQAFSFNNSGIQAVNIPYSSSLNLTNQVTIEFWMKADPGNSMNYFQGLVTSDYYVLSIDVGNPNLGVYGIDFAINDKGTFYQTANANGGGAHVSAGAWHHIAGTYDGTKLQLYIDGQPWGKPMPHTGVISPLVLPGEFISIGSEDGRASCGCTGRHFWGLIDEAAIYNRALSSSEIAAIYNAGSAGKRFTPVAPVVMTQPASQTVLAGGTAAFSVTTTGTGPLSYQWSVNGTNIDGATNITLTLPNVQLPQDGNYYSVLVTNAVGSTNSLAATLTVVLPPTISRQPQSQSVASYNSASFTVAATGTGPLSYQWRKGGTNLLDGGNVSGSATTNLNLTNISLNDAGRYDVVVSNPYATTNSAVAVLIVPQTGMLIGSAGAMSGNTVVVPVLMNALGVENTFLGSVGYNPAALVLQSVQLGEAAAGASLLEVDTKTNSGLVGFAIQFNSGSTMPVGTNEQVALLTFQAQPVTSNTTVSVFFTNNPTLQQVLDNNFDLLPAAYTNGSVTLLPAEYAADVYPRTNGDHQVDARDWQEVGRMVAGLDVPTNSDELLRADCAPRSAPDGVLTVADWVQAGRYALGLDPLTLVTTPPIPGIAAQKSLKSTPLDGATQSRTLRIGSVAAQRGQIVSVPVELVCTTNENAVGLTVNFNTNQLKLAGVTLGSAMTGGSRTNINYHQPGKLGMVVAMSPGASLAPGTNQVLVLQFTTSPDASGQTPLSLDDSVVIRQVVDATANALAANYVNGAVIMPPQPVLATTMTGANLQLTWPVSTGTFHVQSADSPLGPWADTTLTIITNGANATVMVTATNQQQYFRLIGQ
jgi:hypothetical protein